MTATTLVGLTPHSLSGYLSAVGLFRVMADQLDADVNASWVRDEFVVAGPTLDEIIDFLVERYSPTPVFSPWNKEGDPTQNKTTDDQLRRLLDSPDPRFDRYRDTVSAWRPLVESPAWNNLDKAGRLALWRGCAPDDALWWLDAAVAVSTTDAAFPPLLGSGGNDGRLEFSRLLHGELIRLFIDGRQSKHAAGWLSAFLTAQPGPALVESTLGMFDADAAGTPNSAPQGSAPSATNPWAIALTFEGLMGFGSSIASRTGSAQQQLLGAPFMVRPSKLGDDSSQAEDGRGEFWAPMWDHGVRWPELRRTIAEGRLSWNGRQAASSVDAARAVANLGSDRGISSFVRYQLVKRNGLSFVATPSGRIKVRPVQGVADLASIDRWVRDARRAPGAAVARAARHLDRCLIAVTTDDSAPAFQELLLAIVDLERSAGASISGRDTATPFRTLADGRPRLDLLAWRSLVDDGSAECRLAFALASLRDAHDADMPFPSMALAVRGLTGTRSNPQWPIREAHRDHAALAARRAGTDALVEVLRRRLQASDQVVAVDPAATRRPGYDYGDHARLDDVLALLDGGADAERAIRLAQGFALLDTQRTGPPSAAPAPPTPMPTDRPRAGSQAARPVTPDAWFAAVRLCLLGRERAWPADAPLARRTWGRALQSGQLDGVGTDALAALRRRALTSLRRAHSPDADPPALAVALLVRLNGRDRARLLAAIAYPVDAAGPAPKLDTTETTYQGVAP